MSRLKGGREAGQALVDRIREEHSLAGGTTRESVYVGLSLVGGSTTVNHVISGTSSSRGSKPLLSTGDKIVSVGGVLVDHLSCKKLLQNGHLGSCVAVGVQHGSETRTVSLKRQDGAKVEAMIKLEGSLQAALKSSKSSRETACLRTIAADIASLGEAIDVQEERLGRKNGILADHVDALELEILQLFESGGGMGGGTIVAAKSGESSREVQEMQKMLEEAREREKGMRAELAQAQAAAAEAKRTSATSSSMIATATSPRMSRSEHVEELEGVRSRANELLLARDADIAALKAQVASMGAEVNACRERAKALSAEVEFERGKRDELLGEMRGSRSMELKAVKKAEHDLAEQRVANEAMRAKVKEMEKELVISAAKMQELVLKDRASRAAASEAEAIAKRNSQESRDRRYEELKVRFEELVRKEASGTAVIKSTQRRVGELEAEVDAARRERAALVSGGVADADAASGDEAAKAKELETAKEDVLRLSSELETAKEDALRLSSELEMAKAELGEAKRNSREAHDRRYEELKVRFEELVTKNEVGKVVVEGTQRKVLEVEKENGRLQQAMEKSQRELEEGKNQIIELQELLDNTAGDLNVSRAALVKYEKEVSQLGIASQANDKELQTALANVAKLELENEQLAKELCKSNAAYQTIEAYIKEQAENFETERENSRGLVGELQERVEKLEGEAAEYAGCKEMCSELEEQVMRLNETTKAAQSDLEMQTELANSAAMKLRVAQDELRVMGNEAKDVKESSEAKITLASNSFRLEVNKAQEAALKQIASLEQSYTAQKTMISKMHMQQKSDLAEIVMLVKDKENQDARIIELEECIKQMLTESDGRRDGSMSHAQELDATRKQLIKLQKENCELVRMNHESAAGSGSRGLDKELAMAREALEDANARASTLEGVAKASKQKVSELERKLRNAETQLENANVLIESRMHTQNAGPWADNADELLFQVQDQTSPFKESKTDACAGALESQADLVRMQEIRVAELSLTEMDKERALVERDQAIAESRLLVKEMKAAASSKGRLEDEVVGMKEQIESLRKAEETWRAKVLRLEGELDDMSKENDAAVKKFEDLKGIYVQNAKREIGNKEALHRIESSAKETEERLQAKTEEAANLGRELGQARASIEEVSRKIEDSNEAMGREKKAGTETEKAVASIRGERDALLAERDVIVAERDAIIAEKGNAATERDALLTVARGERDALFETIKRVNSEKEALMAERDELAVCMERMKQESEGGYARLKEALQIEKQQRVVVERGHEASLSVKDDEAHKLKMVTSELEAGLKSAFEENQKLRGCTCELEGLLGDARSRADKSEKSLEALGKELEEAKTSVVELTSRIQDKEEAAEREERGDLDEIASLRQKIQDVKRLYETLARKDAANKAALAAAEERDAANKKALLKAEHRIASAQDDYAILKRELSEVLKMGKEREGRLEAELVRREARLSLVEASGEAVAETHARMVQSLRKEIQSAEAGLKAASDDILSLKRRVCELEAGLKDKEDEAQSLQRQVAEAEAGLTSVESLRACTLDAERRLRAKEEEAQNLKKELEHERKAWGEERDVLKLRAEGIREGAIKDVEAMKGETEREARRLRDKVEELEERVKVMVEAEARRADKIADLQISETRGIDHAAAVERERDELKRRACDLELKLCEAEAARREEELNKDGACGERDRLSAKVAMLEELLAEAERRGAQIGDDLKCNLEEAKRREAQMMKRMQEAEEVVSVGKADAEREKMELQCERERLAKELDAANAIVLELESRHEASMREAESKYRAGLEELESATGVLRIEIGHLREQLEEERKKSREGSDEISRLMEAMSSSGIKEGNADTKKRAEELEKEAEVVRSKARQAEEGVARAGERNGQSAVGGVVLESRESLLGLSQDAPQNMWQVTRPHEKREGKNQAAGGYGWMSRSDSGDKQSPEGLEGFEHRIMKLEHDNGVLVRELSSAKRRGDLAELSARNLEDELGTAVGEVERLKNEIEALLIEYRGAEQEALWLRNGMREREREVHRLTAELDANLALLKASKQSLRLGSGQGSSNGEPSGSRGLDGELFADKLKAVEKLAAERTERVHSLEMLMGEEAEGGAAARRGEAQRNERLSTSSTKPVLASDLSCIYDAHDEAPERALPGGEGAERRAALRWTPFATADSKRHTAAQRESFFSPNGRSTTGAASMRGSPSTGRRLAGAIVAMSEAHSLASLANGSRGRVNASRPEGRWSHGDSPLWNRSASEMGHDDHPQDSQAPGWYHTRVE